MSSVIRHGPSSALAPSSPAWRAAWAASSRRLFGRPSTSSRVRSVSAKALVASSTWLLKRVESSASSVWIALKRVWASPSRPTPLSSASRTRDSTMRRCAASIDAKPSPSRIAFSARWIGLLCPIRMKNATTSGCTSSCARRRASLLRTPIRWPTVPQARDSVSVMRVSGSTTASHVGAASASRRSSSPPSSASSARMPGTTTSGVTRSKDGGALRSRSGLADDASLTVAD